MFVASQMFARSTTASVVTRGASRKEVYQNICNIFGGNRDVTRATAMRRARKAGVTVARAA